MFPDCDEHTTIKGGVLSAGLKPDGEHAAGPLDVTRQLSPPPGQARRELCWLR